MSLQGRPGQTAGLAEPLLPSPEVEPPPRPGSRRPGGQAGQAARVVANLVNSGVGTSAVAMPLAVKTLGVGLAVGAMALQSVLGILSNHILSRESSRDDSGSYHDLMRSRFGKWGGRAVAAAQVVNSLGKTVVWLIILADLVVGSAGDGSGLLPELLRAVGRSEAATGGWYLRRWPWILLLALLATPACAGKPARPHSVRSLDRLSGISLVGDLAVALMAVSGLALSIVAGRQGKAHSIHWLPSREEAGVGSKAGLVLEVASVFPIMMGAAFTQNNINSVMGELRPYRQGMLDAAQAGARLLTISIFLTIGISNYVLFGGELQSDVLLNYNSQGLGGVLAARAALGLSVAVRLAFLLNGLLSLPMYLYPYQASGQRNLWDSLPGESSEHRMRNHQSFALTNVASLAGCALVAMLLPSVWKPLKLLGGTAVSCMAFVFPGLVILQAGSALRGSAWERALWALGWLLLAAGLLQMVASIVAQFV